MSSPRALAASLGRAAALAATALALSATTVVECRQSESGSFSAETSCGPAGVLALSYSDGPTRPGCSGCWAFLEAPGANAMGLPEQGEMDTDTQGPEVSTFDAGRFALVGPAPVAGAVPPRSVQRTCRFVPAEPGVLTMTCTGDDPAAACSGTLTHLAPAGGAP